MYVGIARVALHLPEARSLKDRRAVVRGLTQRLRARLPASIAEVGEVERWQVAAVGVAIVARDRARCDEVLDQAVALARAVPEAWVTEVRRQILGLGAGGEELSLAALGASPGAGW